MKKPSSERIASYRQRKKDAGLVELRNRYVRPEWIPAIDEFIRKLESEYKTQQGCRRELAQGQYWSFCGETDMGQSLPALCTECGGKYKLA